MEPVRCNELVTVPVDVFLEISRMELGRLGGHLRAGRKHKRGRPNNLWCSDLCSRIGDTCAEWCVCQVTGQEWTGLRGRGARDTGAGEVKHTLGPKYGLLVPDHDLKPHEWYWLVVGEPPTMRVVGRMLGIDIPAAGREYTHNGRPSTWIVPQVWLFPWA